MKTLKTFFTTLLIAAFVMPAFNGCKKGEEDPGISWRSRNARVTGTWTLKSYSMSGTTDTTIVITNAENDDDYTYKSKTTWSDAYNGTSKTTSNTLKNNYVDKFMWYDGSGTPQWRDQEIVYDNSTSSSSNTTWSFTISLYTDNTYETTETSGNVSGTWDYDWDYDWDDDNDPTANDNDDKDDGTTSTTGTSTSITQGSWYWEDNTKKNKLYINAGIIKGKVVRLSNKEMWVEIQYSNLGGSGEETSNVGSDTGVLDVLLQKYNNNDPLDETNDDETTKTSWNNTETEVMWVFEKTDKNSKRHKATGSN